MGCVVSINNKNKIIKKKLDDQLKKKSKKKNYILNSKACRLPFCATTFTYQIYSFFLISFFARFTQFNFFDDKILVSSYKHKQSPPPQPFINLYFVCFFV